MLHMLHLHICFEMELEVIKKRYFCGHCSKELSKTRFFQHRRLFYNKKTKEWSQLRVFESRLGESFNFSDNEDDCISSKLSIN